jgi:predicted permease
MNWKARLAASLQVDDDVLEELAQHAAATYASARAEGLDERDADRRVMQQVDAWMANPGLLRRRARRTPSVTPPSASGGHLAAALRDLRYAWRLLGRQRLYTALVAATIALGIAATTVIGSVAYGVLLRPLPWAEAPRLVRLYETREGSTRRLRPLMTNASYVEWRTAPATLDGLGAWATSDVTLGEGGAVERIQRTTVTPTLLPLLQATPMLGRAFQAGEEAPGRDQIALLSYGLWQQRFGGRADAIGQSLTLSGTPYTVVGVMPPEFAFPDRKTRVWTPFQISPVVTPGTASFSISMFQAIGRLRPGVTPAQASAEGTARSRNAPPHAPVAMAVFGSDGAAQITAVPLLDSLVAEVRPAILILFAAVLLLLVTAIANVASLQLARATARRRELAIRTALGAGRGRLVGQTLIENALLGVIGGAAGLALAALMHRALPAILPADFPRLDDVALDGRIQVFAIAASVLAGLGCGLLPAVTIARRDLVPALVEDSLAPIGGGVRSRTARLRGGIMAAQIAIATVLLVGAALLGRSFLELMRADVGFARQNVLTARIALTGAEYTPARKFQALSEIVERMHHTPGVTRAAFTTAIPFSSGASLSSFPLRKRDGSTMRIQTGARLVSAGYFAALGQTVLEGREFAPRDAAGPTMVIVNREFSRRYLEGRALGWTLPDTSSRRVDALPGADRPIIGVVADTVRQSVTDTPEPEIFFLVDQQLTAENVQLIVRAQDDPRALVPSLRSIAQAAAPGAPLDAIMTMEDKLAQTLSRPRLYALLLGTFAAFALAIAGVGLFGVLSYSVAQRAREIGVRSALGAQVRDIVGLVLRQSMTIAAAGLAIGLTASLWLTSALQRYLFGVTAHDAASFAAVGVVLLGVAALASVVPARRAARVDPVRVLRS